MKSIIISASVMALFCGLCFSSCGNSDGKNSPVFGEAPGISNSAMEENAELLGKAMTGDKEAADKFKEIEEKVDEKITEADKKIIGKEVKCEMEDGSPAKLEGTLVVSDAQDLMFKFSGSKIVTTADIVFDDKSFDDVNKFVAIIVDGSGTPLFMENLGVGSMRKTFEKGETLSPGSSMDLDFIVSLNMEKVKYAGKAEKIVIAFAKTSKLYKQYKEIEEKRKEENKE